MTKPVVFAFAALSLTALGALGTAESPLASAESNLALRPPPIGPLEPVEAINWREAEKGVLANHVQLTFADRFVKAGEAYFSPDDQRIIFQAIERPKLGEAADEFYAMFIADVVRNDQGRITHLANYRRISPRGSANTCGWFHPKDPNIVIFGSTIVNPTESTPPGYDRGSGRYRWMFPPEMNIVRVQLDKADGTAKSLEVLVGSDEHYIAECAISPDGRYIVYCSLESNRGDLFVYDMETKRKTNIVSAAGYDGGPFFSPDGKRICYRSDRAGNHLLQLYVADLAFNQRGEVIGVQREYQLTDNDDVNWCPFWHPTGRALVYATSEVSHHNYEVFMIDADPGYGEGSNGTIRYGTRKRRITHADRADVLPVFNRDGTLMLWTSQRGVDGESQLWVADFVAPLNTPAPTETPGRPNR